MDEEPSANPIQNSDKAKASPFAQRTDPKPNINMTRNNAYDNYGGNIRAFSPKITSTGAAKYSNNWQQKSFAQPASGAAAAAAVVSSDGANGLSDLIAMTRIGKKTAGTGQVNIFRLDDYPQAASGGGVDQNSQSRASQYEVVNEVDPRDMD